MFSYRLNKRSVGLYNATKCKMRRRGNATGAPTVGCAEGAGREGGATLPRLGLEVQSQTRRLAPCSSGAFRQVLSNQMVDCRHRQSHHTPRGTARADPAPRAGAGQGTTLPAPPLEPRLATFSPRPGPIACPRPAPLPSPRRGPYTVTWPEPRTTTGSGEYFSSCSSSARSSSSSSS